jgi:hypothetical protein
MRRTDNLITFMCRLSWSLGASTPWNPQGLSRPVIALCSGLKRSVGFIYSMYEYIIFPVTLRPNAGHGLLILEVSRSHTTTHHSPYHTSGQVIRLSHIPLSDKTLLTRDKHPFPSAGFKPKIPTSEGSQTHNLDHAATGIGHLTNINPK